ARVLIGNPLPRGIGVSNKVVVVADEKNQKVLKPILEDLLLQPVLMPQPELIFEIVYVLPQDFDDYRAYRNLILALPRNGSPIWKAVAPPYLHKNADDMTVIRYDVWASDQVVVAIAAEDAVGISEQMALNEDRVVSAFDASMGQWLTSILYHAGENIERSSELEQRFGWRLRVPVGYELMDEYADQNFVAFVRQVDRRLLWLWVYWEDRIHPDQLTNDWCLLKRDDVARRFFGGDQTSPGEVNIYQKEFVGKLTVCLEGLWEHAKEWQGGPFKSYALVDVDQDRFFLINMGIYAPNRTKALQMRQLDALAHTFSLRPMYSMKD
ncbi:MAG: DUF4837 family protein, partial [Candidatus Latescibacteria bacterium]|nr:DUF4837 family protein [Candidatus Latescibacterota bacterium]